MIYITASTGVFLFNPKDEKSELVLGNKYKKGILKKKASGYFGICFHKNSNQLIAASREKLGTPSNGKSSTDAALHFINPRDNSHSLISNVLDIHDVHQIECFDNSVFITDTGKNRIVVFDLDKNDVSKIINIGDIRDDIHHINAATVHRSDLLVGLNNRGHKESEILTLPLDILKSKETNLNGLTLGTVSPVKGYMHTHDIEHINGNIFVCASHKGKVVIKETGDVVFSATNWVRGITKEENGIWVGQSHYAKRLKRHKKKLNGTINLLSNKDYRFIKSITVAGTGQINDLFSVDI